MADKNPVQSPSPGLRVFIEARPGGRPTLFLHGLTASSSAWSRILPLCPSLSAIVPDLLGFGGSPKPDAPYDLETHLAALAPVVEQYHPTAVIGHSMGAVIAAGALQRWPSIASGVLVSPAIFASRQEAIEAMRAAPALHRLTLRSPPAARAMCEISCMLRPALKRIAPLFAGGLPPEVVRAEFDHTWNSYSRSMDNLVLGGLVPGLLARVGDRVSIVHGRNDRTVPLSLVEPLGPLVRRLVTIDGDHLAILRNPSAVASACVDLLGSAPAAR